MPIHADAVPGPDALQPWNGHQVARLGLIHAAAAASVIYAKLVDLLPAGKLVLDAEGARQQLEKAQPSAAGFVTNVVAPGGEWQPVEAVRISGGKAAEQGQEAVHALPGQRRPGHNREALPLPYQPYQRIHPHGCVIALGEQPFQQRFVPLGNSLLQRLIHTAGLLQGTQVDDVRGEAAAHLPDERLLIRTGAVNLVQEDQHGHTVALQQPPDRLGVTLHALGAADHQYRIVHHRQRPLHLRGEVHMPRRIQPVDGITRQLEAGLAGEDRDAPLPLHGIRVQEGILMIHPPQGSDSPGAVEHLFGQGGLACIHMGQNADGLAHGCIILSG